MRCAVRSANLDLTLNGIIYTADPSSAFAIGGQTLKPGGSISVSGTQISLAVGGTLAAVGTSIQLLSPADATAKASILIFEGTTYTAVASSAFTYRWSGSHKRRRYNSAWHATVPRY